MIEKVKIGIKYYGLKCLCDLYDYRLKDFDTSILLSDTRKSFKASKNVVDIIVIKFKKKLLTKDENSTKLIKITLEYNEAYFLMQFIHANVNFYTGILERTLLNSFADKLNQQL